MNRFYQLQSWPTPEIFVSVDNGPREVQDTSIEGVSLVSVIVYTPQTQSISEPNNTLETVSLIAMTKDGPFTRSITPENQIETVSLVAMVQNTPVSQSITVEQQTEAVSAVAMIRNTPISQTITVEQQNETVSLIQMTKN